MKDINKNKLNNIINSSAEIRYSYFIRKIADFEQIWGLYYDGWAVLGDEKNEAVIPFWPEEEFAELCAEDAWSKYQPKAISLDDFLEKWIPGMRKDNTKIGVFYVPTGKGIITTPDKLLEDINEELEQY
jgi:hypothetical protein